MRSVLEFDQDGLEAYCVIDWVLTGGGEPDAQVLAEAIRDDFWQGGLRARTSSAVTLVHIRTGQEPDDYLLSLAQTGSVAGGAAPPNCTFLITKNVATGHRGRIFWPGLPENYVSDGGRISATFFDDIQTSIDDGYAAMVASGIGMVVQPAAGGTPNAVTTLALNSVIGSLPDRRYN